MPGYCTNCGSIIDDVVARGVVSDDVGFEETGGGLIEPAGGAVGGEGVEIGEDFPVGAVVEGVGGHGVDVWAVFVEGGGGGGGVAVGIGVLEELVDGGGLGGGLASRRRRDSRD